MVKMVNWKQEAAGVLWLLVLFVVHNINVVETSKTYNVVSFGAVGDGVIDDTQKFRQAWTSICQDSSSPTLLVPSRHKFLLKQIKFSGPCRSAIHVQILGDLVAPSNPWKTSRHSNWIQFHRVQDLTFDGNGQIDGQGSKWWDCFRNKQFGSRPCAFGVYSCNNFHLSGLKFINPPMMHVILYGLSGAVVSGITINAPKTSPNTDGVHIQKCQNVQITDSSISTGDDCISIGKGTRGIDIRGITCISGHGISIGSLGIEGTAAKVQQINVSHSNFIGTSNGARIKTWQGGSGFARGITFEHLNFDSVQYPVIIDQSYCPHCQPEELRTAVAVSDVHFIGLTGTSVGVPITIKCSKNVPCTGIVMQDVNIKRKHGSGHSVCENAHGRQTGTIVPPVSCLVP